MTEVPTYRNQSIDFEIHHERLEAVFIGIPEACLGPCQPSMTEFFYGNS